MPLHFITGMFPGSFPSRVTEQAVTEAATEAAAQAVTVPLDGTCRSMALDMCEAEFNTAFEAKSRHVLVHDLIVQLNSAVFLLAGYQLVRICHLSCVLPFALHCAYNAIVLPSMANGSDAKIAVLRRWLSPNDQVLGSALTPNPQILAGEASLFQLIRALLLWKTIVTLAAHALFVIMWEVVLARANKLKLISNGAWWFVSFIGESTPTTDISQLTTIEIAIKLGLIQLLASDIAILCIQMVLLQLIYGQSDILVEREFDMKYLVPMSLKTKSKPGLESDDHCANMESLLPRNIITVKLYECL